MDNLQIRKRDIFNMTQELGSGSFGTVYRASWAKPGCQVAVVAVKVLHDHVPDAASLAWDEIDRMRGLSHPNVVKLLGYVQSGQGAPWIVTEFMKDGDLHSLLTQTDDLTYNELVNYAYGVAGGMKYLHRKLEYHGDLAARNCLVGPNMTIKIADFGQLKEGYGEHYYNGAGASECPLRWMPPENVPQDGEGASYSLKGDVWSYGVVLFEMWTRGLMPYSELSDEEVLTALRDGENPLSVEEGIVHARPWVLDLMDWCFEVKPGKRPFMNQIMNMITEQAEEELVAQ